MLLEKKEPVVEVGLPVRVSVEIRRLDLLHLLITVFFIVVVAAVVVVVVVVVGGRVHVVENVALIADFATIAVAAAAEEGGGGGGGRVASRGESIDSEQTFSGRFADVTPARVARVTIRRE